GRSYARRIVADQADASLADPAVVTDVEPRRAVGVASTQHCVKELATMNPRESRYATAILGGGCFWCLDAVFRDLDGVIGIESGYAGGKTANPTYEDVCGGTTGHAEVVRITFDPAVVSFRDLLGVFFTIHDPTTLNRQGND